MQTQTTTAAKLFVSRSNARRALKAYGEKAIQLADSLLIEQDGQFGFIPSQVEIAINQPAEAVAAFMEPVVVEMVDAEVQGVTTQVPANLTPVQATAYAVAELLKNNPVPTGKVQITNESTVENPCKLVWHIADAMPGAKRKDVLAACVSAGVAYYTARTQYQQWSSVTRKKA